MYALVENFNRSTLCFGAIFAILVPDGISGSDI